MNLVDFLSLNSYLIPTDSHRFTGSSWWRYTVSFFLTPFLHLSPPPRRGVRKYSFNTRCPSPEEQICISLSFQLLSIVFFRSYPSPFVILLETERRMLNWRLVEFKYLRLQHGV